MNPPLIKSIDSIKNELLLGFEASVDCHVPRWQRKLNKFINVVMIV